MNSHSQRGVFNRILLRERGELVFVLAIAAFIPLVWFIFLGWNTRLLIANHDGVDGVLPYLIEFFRDRGRWQNLLYQAEWLGGVNLLSVEGSIPIHEICARLGVAPERTVNLTVWLIQLFYAYFGAKAALDMTQTLGSPRRTSWPTLLGCTLIFAFAPALGWRIFYGHFNLLLGFLVFLCPMSVLLSTHVRSLTLTQLFLAVFAMLHAFPTKGQQAIAYSALFGYPVLLTLAWTLRKPGPSHPDFPERIKPLSPLGLAFLAVTAALGLSAYKYAPMIASAFSSDAPRALDGSTSVTFSKIIATSKDWLLSLFWTRPSAALSGDASTLHETNYPLGPPLLLLLLFPWKKYRFLGISILLSAGLVILFSMNMAPVSSFLLEVFPPLNGFRVPARGILPLIILILVLGVAGVLSRYPEEKTRGSDLAIVSAFILLAAVIPGEAFPAKYLLATAALLAMKIFYAKHSFNRISGQWVILMLGVASLLAFKVRSPGYFEKAWIEETRAAGQSLRQAYPELDKPLVRSVLDSKTKITVPANLSVLLGVSTPGGYLQPPKRFIQLVSALEGVPYEADRTIFGIDPRSAMFPVFRELYHVDYKIWLGDTLSVEPLKKTIGKAWFSNRVAPISSFETLASELKNHERDLKSALRGTLWVVKDDPDSDVQQSIFRTPGAEGCSEAKVIDVFADRHSPTIKIRVETGSTCPLTLSTNFVTDLHARAVQEGSPPRELSVFPSYGALTGILVPAGTREILIEPELFSPPWLSWIWFLGLLSLVASAALYLRWVSAIDAAESRARKEPQRA